MSISEPFKNIEKMLTKCAEGHKIRNAKFNRRIEYKGKIYYSFPSSKYKDIEIGHLKSLIRLFEIDANCAKDYVNI